MNDRPDPASSTPTSAPARKSGRGMLWATLAVVLAFLVGFGWQFYEATTVRGELAIAEEQLAVERLRVRLGQATLAAQSGDYEDARRQMSRFFTHLNAPATILPEPVRAVTDDFLAMRDDVITGLSRSNPEYAGVLYRMTRDLQAVADPYTEDGPPPAERPTTEPLDESALPDTTPGS